MGAVFKATQVSMGRVVALKILPRKLARNEAYVQRFLREARSAARLNHPNIVQAIDVGYADGYYYFAMEFVEGRTLSDIIEADGPLSERRALEIIRDVARGLRCAHSAGIIHRDVKPNNILVAPDGCVKLADLGLARETTDNDASITVAGSALGTPGYISPEQVRGETNLDGRTDVYGLGATFYHLVVGTAPYDGGTHAEVMSKHLTEPVPEPRQKAPQLSPESAAIIQAAMQKRREDRYASMSEFLEDVESVLRGKPLRHAQVATRRRAAPRTLNRTYAYVGGGLLVIAIAVAAFWLTTRPQSPPAAVASDVPAPRPDQPAAAAREEEVLASLRKWAADHPGEYRETIRRYEAAIPLLTDPHAILKAHEELQETNFQRANAADAAFEQLEGQAKALADSGDYDGAINVFRSLPAELADLLTARAEAAAARLREEGEARVRRSLDKAAAFSKAGRPADAIAVLDALERVRYDPMRAEIARLREQYEAETRDLDALQERRALVDALQELERLLEKVEAAAASGDLMAAARIADAALVEQSLRPVEERVRLLAEVCALLPKIAQGKRSRAAAALRSKIGEVISLPTTSGVRSGRVKDVSEEGVLLEKSVLVDGEMQRQETLVQFESLQEGALAKYGVSWQPSTASEAIAEALLALGARNVERLADALKAAEGHWLCDRYREKLAALRRAALEDAARAFWDANVKPLTADKAFSEAAARAAEATLRKFRAEFGATEFAKSVEEALAALDDRIAATFGGEELTQVRRLFRGKVLAYDPKEHRITLFYDFSRREQLEDWYRSKWYREKGGVLEVADEQLVLADTRMQVLTRAQFTAAKIEADFAVSGGTHAVTLVVCSNGQGSHYELLGLWKSKDPPEWRCHLCKYIGRQLPEAPFGEGGWPVRPSPFATTKRGTFSLSVEDGRLVGRVGDLVLEAEDKDLQSGSVGVWAYDAGRATFDNITIHGVLAPGWLEKALKKDELGAGRGD